LGVAILAACSFKKGMHKSIGDIFKRQQNNVIKSVVIVILSCEVSVNRGD